VSTKKKLPYLVSSLAATGVHEGMETRLEEALLRSQFGEKRVPEKMGGGSDAGHIKPDRQNHAALIALSHLPLNTSMEKSEK